MPVIAFSESEQRAVVSQYNNIKKKQEQIPLVLRNSQTGWPLLQVSLFTAKKITNNFRYEHVLGGGNCHYLHIGAFNLASLLTKVYGKSVVTGDQRKVLRSDKLRVENVSLFLEEFNMSHKGIGVTIHSSAGSGYGKSLKVSIPLGNSDNLESVLLTSFSFAVKEESHLVDIIGHYYHGMSADSFPGYSPLEIDRAINKEVAAFFNGQIFIDLGAFLETTHDAELREFFKTIFRVDEFRKLQEVNPNFKPQENRNEELNLELTRLLQNAKMDYPKLNNIYLKINAIRDYGLSLAIKDKEKSEAIINLATQLEAKVDNFYKKMFQTYPSKIECATFKNEFKELLHSQDEIMKDQKRWQSILGNTFASLSGVWYLALSIKTGVTAAQCYKNGDKLTLNHALFFAKNGITKAEKAINSAPEYIEFTL